MASTNGSGPGTEHVKTRFLIISDTHNCGPLTDDQFHVAYREPLPRADVLLHAGDITMSGRVSEYRQMAAALARVDAELKLVIAGNHDATLDKEYYDRFGTEMHYRDPQSTQEAWDLWHSPETRNAGIRYLEEGLHTFSLSNGATFTIYTSPYQPEFCNWAFPYEHHVDRFNTGAEELETQAINPIPDFPGADIVMTHGPPFQILDRTRTGQPVGCPHLLRAMERCRPLLHCFGHIHEAWGASRVRWNDKADHNGRHLPLIESVKQIGPSLEEWKEDYPAELDLSIGSSDQPLIRGKETAFVNASIMNLHYRPFQSPWVVDLDLPSSGGRNT